MQVELCLQNGATKARALNRFRGFRVPSGFRVLVGRTRANRRSFPSLGHECAFRCDTQWRDRRGSLHKHSYKISTDFKCWLQPPLIFQQAPLASSLDSELVSRIMIATGPRRGGRGGRARRWTGQHVLVLQHAQVLCQIGQGLASGFGARNAPFDV